MTDFYCQMKKKNSQATSTENKVFSLVAIVCASDESNIIDEILRNLKPDTGMSFAYLATAGEDSVEGTVDRLSKINTLNVEIARNEQPIESNRLYVMPPESDLVLGNGMFQALKSPPRTEGRKPADRLLVSVAKNWKGGVIGVLLSPNGEDGIGGLKAIKIAGGITIAREDTTLLDNAPSAAAMAGVVDLALAPEAIGQQLNSIAQQTGGLADIHIGSVPVSDTDEHLQSIISFLKKTTRIDFTHYKISTVKRRIVRRMLLNKLESLKAYLDYLRRHSGEINLLYHDLLINVTCFFRDNDAMEYLRKAILPQILKTKTNDDQIRIWVPACSTGEEAYSLAILLTEIQDENGSNVPVQIFGTDLSEIAISKARLGIYSSSDLADISQGRVNKYFVRTENNSYRVSKRIRDLCVFAQHNVFKDPPFSRLDLISCCNFFIYLENALQQKCAAIYYYALNPNGFLVLGRSETISASGLQLFSQVEKKFKVYKKKSDASPKVMTEINYRLPVQESRETIERKRPAVESQPEPAGLEKVVDDILYTRYIPATVVINQEMEILQFRGSTGLFLEPARGKANFNLMKMVRPGLTFELRNCIHKAQTTLSSARKTDVEMKVKDASYLVSLEVLPLQMGEEGRLFLVIFEEQRERAGQDLTDFSRDEVVRKLQEELISASNDMQAIIDEHEANKEELQSANEEIISSNEELQSINEELETSKEEVESSNEELTAINAELQITNEQLLESQEYAEAIFATIREGVLVITTDFRVKMANAAFYRAFHTEIQQTEGRLLYEIGEGQLNKPEMKDLINKILLHDMQLEGYEFQYYIPKLGPRTMLVNGKKLAQKANKQELMLLAFEDITDRKRAEALTAEREEWFRNMANNAPVMIWTAGPDGLRNFFNITWLIYTGRSMEQEMADGWIKDVLPADKEMFLSIYNRAFEDRKPFLIEYRLRRYDGEYRWVKAIGRPTFSPEGQFTGFVGICTEIHDSKIMQVELERIVSERTQDLLQVNKELKKSNAELQQFAYVASHDLQEPLRKILIFSDRLTSAGDMPAGNREYVDKIADSAHRMSQLINDLLDFSRATRTDGHFADTDLAITLQSTLQDFDMLIKEKNAIIVAGELPVINAIPVQMKQLFHNLIGNSLKFSKERTQPVIKVGARQLSKEEIATIEGLDSNLRYIEILFEDNGIGFSNEYSEQIFVLFQRLNGRHAYPGTGIGLALCRKIVDNHGGKIFASSIESIHTEFHVILPVERSFR